MDNKYSIQNRFLKDYSEVGNIAKYYGFQPILAPEVKKIDIDNTKNFLDFLYPAEYASILRMYFEEKGYSLSQPLMLWMTRPFRGTGEKKRPNRLECTLISLGSTKSITDCLTIRAGISTLETLGYKDIKLRLNSIGDKDSVGEFERKMNSFVRKNFNLFPSELRQAIKKDIFALARDQRKEWAQFQVECPKSIDFLSEASRAYLKEILEFLEIMDINYTIDHSLLGDPHFGSETIFSLHSKDISTESLGVGTRVAKLSRKLGFKKDLGSVILNISAKQRKALKKTTHKEKKLDFYLIQFGPEAKLKSLIVLEEIRKTGKNVSHAIAKDKLSSQIGIAENSGADYILLLGQKEALENSILLRNVQNHSQELIPIAELATKIKHI